MDNFCTRCGNKLDGKSVCDKCGHVTEGNKLISPVLKKPIFKLAVGIAFIVVIFIFIFNIFIGNSGVGKKYVGNYKVNLSNSEIIDCAVTVFGNYGFSNKTPTLVSSTAIGQDSYGRCAAILQYNYGGILGVKEYLVWVDGVDRDNNVHWKNDELTVENTLNNTQLTK